MKHWENANQTQLRHRFFSRGSHACRYVLGTIIRDTQIRAIKNVKKHTNHNHQGTGPSSSDSPDPSGPRTQVLTRPTLRASDASSDSPDPSGPRTQVPTRPTPQGLERKFRLARPLETSDASSDSPDPDQARAPDPTPTEQQDFHHTALVPATLQTRWLPYRSRARRQLFQPPRALQHHLFHCVPLPLSLWRTASQ